MHKRTKVAELTSVSTKMRKITKIETVDGIVLGLYNQLEFFCDLELDSNIENSYSIANESIQRTIDFIKIKSIDLKFPELKAFLLRICTGLVVNV